MTNGPTTDPGQERARSFVKQLINQFQILIDQSLLDPPKDQTAEQPRKISFEELAKPLSNRFEKVKSLDPKHLLKELRHEFDEKKKQMELMLVSAEELLLEKGVEAAEAKLLEANEKATELLSLRYQEEKGTKKYGDEDLREFEGKEMLERYKRESTYHYENKEMQEESSDYMDREGHLVDHKGVKIDGEHMYTSRLDEGTSHKFDGKTGHHSYATEGTAVIGAGSRVVENGIVRKITGDSGHYTPSAKNIHEYTEGLMEQGIKLIDDESLFMPDPKNPNQHIKVDDPAILENWTTVVNYEKKRAQKKGNEELGEYNSVIAKVKQELADLEVWPGQKDTEIEVVKDGTLFSDEDIVSVKSEGPDQAASKVVAMLIKRIGPRVKTNKGEIKEITPEYVLICVNAERKSGNKIKSLFEMTREDINTVIGVFLRLRRDEISAGESKARIQMSAEQFLQTGGNHSAIDKKNEFMELLAPVESKEDSDRARTLYEKLGGDEILLSMFQVHDPESIDAELKSAWVVKKRITNDYGLNAILAQRFPKEFPGILQNFAPTMEWKLRLLAADKWDPNWINLLTESKGNAELGIDVGKEGDTGSSYDKSESESPNLQEDEESESDNKYLQKNDKSESESPNLQEGDESESDNKYLQKNDQSESESPNHQEDDELESDNKYLQKNDQSESESPNLQKDEESESIKQDNAITKDESSSEKGSGIPTPVDEIEKVDLRKVRKGATDGLSAKAYEELGGDKALLDLLLESWNQKHSTILNELRQLEKDRNEVKKPLDSYREMLDKQGKSKKQIEDDSEVKRLDGSLKEFDVKQNPDRKRLEKILSDTRPTLSALELIEKPKKLEILKNASQGEFDEILQQISNRNAK